MIVKLSKKEIDDALTTYIKNKLVSSSSYVMHVMQKDVLPEKGINIIVVTKGSTHE